MQMLPRTRSILLSTSSRLHSLARIALVIVAMICSLCAMAQIPWQAHDPVQLPPNEAGLLLWVTDPSGAVIQNAHVAIVNARTQEEVEGTTDMYGVFKARGLRAETYTVTTSSRSFRVSQTREELTPGVQREIHVPLDLAPDIFIIRVDRPSFPVAFESIPGLDAFSIVAHRRLQWINVEALPPGSVTQTNAPK
jgi:Carboxypeptidase regulatory-like domain